MGLKSRAIFDFGGENSYTFRMEQSQDGESWALFMESRDRRED